MAYIAPDSGFMVFQEGPKQFFPTTALPGPGEPSSSRTSRAEVGRQPASTDEHIKALRIRILWPGRGNRAATANGLSFVVWVVGFQ